MAEEQVSENPRKLAPSRVLAPIGMMVGLFILTIGLALIIAPLYLRQGLQAFGSEGASNPLIAVYYLVMILVVTGVILLLRKFLKKRKKKFLKYILGAAVLLSTYAVIWPLLSAAVYGLPPELEEHGLSMEDPKDAIQPSTLIYEHSFGSLSEDGSVRTISSDPGSSYRLMGEVVFQKNGKNSSFWFGAPGQEPTTVYKIELDGEEPTQALPVSSGVQTLLLVTLSGGDGVKDALLSSDGTLTTLKMPKGIANLTYYGNPPEGFLGVSNGTIYSCSLKVNGTERELLALDPRSLGEAVLWIKSVKPLVDLDGAETPSRTLVGTDGGLWSGENYSSMDKVSDILFPDPSLIWLAHDEKGWEIVGIRGNKLYVIDHDGETPESPWTLTDYDYVMIFEDRPGGILTVVSSELVEHYELPEIHNSSWVHLASFMMAAGLVIVLFIKPKWWIVDIAGILMGAGVLSLIGISLSILPILLFLILLAVYDFISVYKTKHMLTLAESVVESKLPILLVFPQKMGYKYEEEKNLLDKSRPREALFMGLGDVIIPGTLIVSASTFLAGEEGLSILGMPPQYIVVITSMIGLFIGYSVLMYMVLKGKAQAGLPFLNTGTIIGFFVGELIAYGTIIIL